MGPAVCPLRVERQARAVMRHLRHKKLETTMHYIRGITLSGEEEYTVKTARADKSTTVIVGCPEKITILDARARWLNALYVFFGYFLDCLFSRFSTTHLLVYPVFQSLFWVQVFLGQFLYKNLVHGHSESLS
jgi:hypothetical protein